MKYDLNDNNDLINFFNYLFRNEELNSKAPTIMKFFILTRNYGLNNFEKYINKIYYDNDFFGAVIDAFNNGFKEDNIEFNNTNFIAAIINNYYENGFYFHSFPGIYAKSISENGILASNRGENDDKFYEIVKKYRFGEYFEKSKNRVCVTEKLDNFSVREYALFTPEWLEFFLKIGYDDFHDIYERGNLDEMLNVSNIALQNIKTNMKEKPYYNENDFLFLANYINNIVYNRFKNGNNHIGIALIPRKNSKEYFGEKFSINNKASFEKYFNDNLFSKKAIVDFLINTLPVGEKNTDKTIPNNIFGIVTYDIKNRELLDEKKY